MARDSGNQKWRRYRPPGELRDETGARAEQSSSSTSSRSSASSSTSSKKSPKSASTSSSKSTASRSAVAKSSKSSKSAGSSSDRTGVITAVLVAFVIGLPVTIGVIASITDDSDDYDPGDVDTSLLDAGFIAKALAEAQEVEGRQAVGVRLDEYGIDVEFFDPNTDLVRTYSKDDGTDSYSVDVEDNRYDDYRPVPFYLDELDPAVMVQAGEDALAGVDDPYTYSVDVNGDREDADDVVISGYAAGSGDSVNVEYDIDGDRVEE